MKLILKNSAIKGYHIFKITPLIEMTMIVEREEENEFDPYAMVIKTPEIDHIPPEDRNKITREKEPQQRLKDIAGKVAGRVPANISKLFSLMDLSAAIISW